MLQKKPSNKQNQWKYALLVPLLAAFMFAFNTKTIAQKKKIELKEVNELKVELIIDKNSTDATLESEKETFKNEFDIDLKFKGIKRNSNGEITAIKIDAKSPTSNANFSTSGSKPIKPILITYNSKNNSFSIGNMEENHKTIIYNVKEGEDVVWVEKDEDGEKLTEKIIIKKKGDKHNVWVHSDDDTKHKTIKIVESKDGETKVKVIEESDVHFNSDDASENDKGENVFIIKTEKDINKDTNIEKESNIRIISSDNKEPLFILNGKIISQKEMKDLDPNSIESINVLKDKAATSVYGKKGANGVIVIITKK